MRWLSVSSNAAGLKEQCEEIWQAVQAIKEPPDVALIFPVAADPEWTGNYIPRVRGLLVAQNTYLMNTAEFGPVPE